MPAERQEVEIKLRLVEPDGVRARLRALGAARVGVQRETNHILDTADRRLLASGCALRVRVAVSADSAAGGAATGFTTLTFKGPAEGTAIRSREEVETRVEDGDALLALLARLGYREFVRFEKRRESWRLDDCTVTLDELPRLGWWTEIEGASVPAVAATRGRLGLEGAEAVTETFVAMAARCGLRDEAGCIRLEFGDGGTAAVGEPAEA